jgi:hypothetical protein
MNRTHQVLADRILGICFALSLAGCGTPAAPLPPSLHLPTPVLNLAAIRVGNAVRLSWTMPARTTDKVLLRAPVDVQVCRAVATGDCIAIANLNLPPGQARAYSDELPPDLTQGPARLLRYEVTMRNHAGKSAGPSNAAYSAAGAGPAALTGLTAQVRADGVLLSWLPVPVAGQSMLFRIQRLKLSASSAEQQPRSPLAPATPPSAQTFAVHAQQGLDPGHAIDASVQFDQQYRYTVERVETPDLASQAIDLQGLPSEPIMVTTTDKFPPQVPQGLVAVADAAAGAIDLSWAPDTEADLAAYQVYRRDTLAAAPPQRLATVHAETSFRDTTAQPGHTYAYSLSASDQNNNESRRSPEVEETLPTH